jgi:integrase
MASIRKKRNKWQAQVRLKDGPYLSKSFALKRDAELWAAEQERKIRLGELDQSSSRSLSGTLGDLIKRYRDEVAANKKCAPFETSILTALLRSKLSLVGLNQNLVEPISRYRDQRLCNVGPDIVRRELGILQHMFNIARMEWGMPIPTNPLQLIKKPSPSKPRERRLSDTEFELLMSSIAETRNKFLKPIIQFALATAMRRGEMLMARWGDINWNNRTIFIEEAKNGWSRTIPLSSEALDILNLVPKAEDRIFPTTAMAIQLAWQRLTKRAGIEDLHFHDLRHEAISRFFEMGLSIPEVALISGHRDVRQLFRYTHLRAEDVAKKLR